MNNHPTTDKELKSKINKMIVEWLDGTKIPGAIVATNDIAEQLEKLLSAHTAAAVEEALKKSFKVASVTTIAKDDPLQDAFDTWVDVNGQRFGINVELLSDTSKSERGE